MESRSAGQVMKAWARINIPCEMSAVSDFSDSYADRLIARLAFLRTPTTGYAEVVRRL